MRRTRLLAAAAVLLALQIASPVEGQSTEGHPIVGTWQLNLAASSYEPGTPPQAVTRRFGIDDEGFLMSIRITVAPNGNPTFAMARARLDGGDYPVWTNAAVYGMIAEGATPPSTASFEVVDARTLRLTQKNGGEVMGVSPNTWAVSSDGSTLTVTTMGTNANGAEVHNVEVYDRVEN